MTKNYPEIEDNIIESVISNFFKSCSENSDKSQVMEPSLIRVSYSGSDFQDDYISHLCSNWAHQIEKIISLKQNLKNNAFSYKQEIP